MCSVWCLRMCCSMQCRAAGGNLVCSRVVFIALLSKKMNSPLQTHVMPFHHATNNTLVLLLLLLHCCFCYRSML
jgi:hypothetical protein